MPPTSSNEETPRDPRDSILPKPSGNLSRFDKPLLTYCHVNAVSSTCRWLKGPCNGRECHEIAHKVCEAVHGVCRQGYELSVYAFGVHV